MILQDEPRAPGQVWVPKAWPGSLYLLLFLDEERSNGEVEVWAALDLEKVEVRDLNFNKLLPTSNKRFA